MYSTAFLDIPALATAGGSVQLPGSKSISNRVLLLAALSRGTTTIHDLLDSDDTRVMLDALRALAQSMARELGPKNIHVAHVVVDGAIDTDFIRESFPERYALKDQDGILNPDHIADNYWHLHAQPRDAWTHELDLRPWMERW